MNSKTIYEKLDRIDDLPTLPTIALKVNTLLEDPNTSIDTLTRVIEKDQAIVGKLLKLVNSAFYGFRSKVHDISNALTLLGFNTIRNAILSFSIMESFKGKKNLAGFDITDFWKHSIAVAVTGRYLAETVRIGQGDNCFVAGLLHDIGKPVLCEYFPDIFEKIWVLSQENGSSFYEAETGEIPVRHPGIGSYLVKKWQLPRELVESVAFHHQPDDHTEDNRLVRLIHFSDYIVNHYKSGEELDVDTSGLDPDGHQKLLPLLERPETWYSELSHEIEASCEIFME